MWVIKKWKSLTDCLGVYAIYNDGCSGTQSAVVIENYFPLIAIQSDWVANECGQLTVKVNLQNVGRTWEGECVFGDGPKEEEKCEIWMFYSQKMSIGEVEGMYKERDNEKGEGRRERMGGEGGVCWYVKSLVRPGAWVFVCLMWIAMNKNNESRKAEVKPTNGKGNVGVLYFRYEKLNYYCNNPKSSCLVNWLYLCYGSALSWKVHDVPCADVPRCRLKLDVAGDCPSAVSRSRQRLQIAYCLGKNYLLGLDGCYLESRRRR